MRNIDTYINECGEKWWFEFNEKYNIGTLYGNDNLISGIKFPIFNGECLGLILNNNEKNWLYSTWNKYSHTNISILTNILGTYLQEDICPICLRKKTNFEWHHCIPSSCGGSDDVVNVLSICCSCHRIITSGDDGDIELATNIAIEHQKMIYGIGFYQMNPKNNKKYPERFDYLYTTVPEIKTILDEYNKLNKDEQEKVNQAIKSSSMYKYHFYKTMFTHPQLIDVNYLKWINYKNQ